MSEQKFKVSLNVYDLSMGYQNLIKNRMAKQLSSQFLGTQFDGIWHTGIVVYGIKIIIKNRN
jgi:desumoylating isopeptidase 1